MESSSLAGGKCEAISGKKPRAVRAITADAAISSTHIQSMELESSCWARALPSISLTLISVGARAWFIDSEIRFTSRLGISAAARNASIASDRP